jgi:tetratricopeptide (TPR) repeat protein
MDYYEQGVERQRSGDMEGALRYLTWALQRDPDLVDAYVARSSVYLAQGSLFQALDDADVALEIVPSARSYLLRGEALRRMGEYREALEAYEKALRHDPGLKRETFSSRWSAARAAGNTDGMSSLSDEYGKAHPDDPLRHYYRAWVALESGAQEDAIRVLVEGMAESTDPPALLWYLLGQIYCETGAWMEAVASLETTRALVEAGDNSLVVHADPPVAHLFVALGQAYLGAGRCADAESMLTYAVAVGAPASDSLPLLRQAQSCERPTPILTPNATKTPSTE